MNQKVDPDQIKGLANHMERLRMGIGESTAKVYRDISQLIRDTRSAYSESSVQAAVNEVDRVLQEIRKLSQSIDDRLGSKAKTLRRVAQDYVRVEKEAEQKIQSAMKTVQLRAGNSVELNKRVQKVVKVKTVESLDDVKPNDANLKMLLRQFLDEFGYEVMPGEVSVDITMDEHVLDFWEFALAKGYDPVTYDYLEYWERSEAYRRMEEKINELRSAQESYKESMLDGYEVLAFGKGFYIGLDNSINNIADKFAEIVSHPVASGEALLQGIKQVYINLNEEAGKFNKDPLSYIQKAAVNKWTSLKDVYVELQELKPSQRWERIGGMVGENIIAAATSAVGGGIVGAGLKKVFIIIESKIDINIPIKDIDKITGNETKAPSELQSPDVTKPPKAVEAPQTPEVNKSIEGTGSDAQTPRTGTEWDEYFRSKYGDENVDWKTDSEYKLYSDKYIPYTPKIRPNAVITKPSLPKGGKPEGNYAPIKGKDIRGLKRQNEAANVLAENGYRTTMLDEVPNGNGFDGNGYGIDPGKSPDFIIERQVYDCYAPDIDTKLNNILRTLREKTTKQARRIVLNLNDYPVEKRTELIEFIKSQTNKDLKHLDELLIIEDRQVTRAYWRFE
ncbi:hypothetical protein KB559_16820 [Paenibacillus sp. Marseille-P2973]|nr:hypothetical protein [Paenibacillus sp. Marseille-P2973]MBQ4900501.1 hypothetical protein [Paenibacillus sp. Marseille-P2973]